MYTAERLRYDYYSAGSVRSFADRSADQDAADFRRPQAHGCHDHFGWGRRAPVRRTLAVHPRRAQIPPGEMTRVAGRITAPARPRENRCGSRGPRARRRRDRHSANEPACRRNRRRGQHAHAKFGALRIVDRRLLVIEIVVPVGTPLPDVAVHVVQAEGVGLKSAHRSRPGIAVATRQERDRDRGGLWVSLLVECREGRMFVRPQRFPVLIRDIRVANEILRIVAERISGLRARAAGVFPFRLGRLLLGERREFGRVVVDDGQLDEIGLCGSLEDLVNRPS